MVEPTKLKNAGESVTFTCASAKLLTFGQYPEVEFAGRDGAREVVVRVPQKSADRQLGRIPLTYAECAGKSLTIGRTANTSDPAKPYWDITSNGTAGSPPAASASSPAPTTKPTPAAAPPAAEALEGSALYAKITAWVLREIVPQYANKGIPLSQEGTAAIVATLYIEANRHT